MEAGREGGKFGAEEHGDDLVGLNGDIEMSSATASPWFRCGLRAVLSLLRTIFAHLKFI